MSLPKEPRQKMINMMYLVLTALLALNVSVEILNAFKTVDQSLRTANTIVEQKNVDIFKSFDALAADPKTKEKADLWRPKADKAKALADDAYKYLEDLKLELKKESGLKLENGVETFKEDNLDAATRLLVSAPPNGKGKGKDLLDKLKSFKAQLLAIDPDMTKEVGANLPLDLSIPKTANEVGKDDWAFTYFHMTPTIAALTIMSKFQNDIKNSEAEVVEYCHKQVGAVKVQLDQFAAIAQASSNYVMPGEQLMITAGVGAFSKAAQPSITIDGVPVKIKEDGTAEYPVTVSGSGPVSKKVHFAFTKQDGTVATVDKEVKYVVGIPAGLVVSTEKTRVFYKGLDNPLSVSGGGGDEKINLTVEGPDVTFRKDAPGQYIVKPNQLGSVTVVVSDGKNTKRETIPVKKVPNPIAIIGGSAGGTMGANIFRVQKGVIADLRDFVFEGIKFDVLSYMVICTGKGFDEPAYEQNNGPSFNGEALSLIRRCQAGTTVTIGEIKLTEPGGGTRKLDQTITFILQ